MSDEPSKTRGGWPEVGLRTILFLIVPYAAALIWIWTWGLAVEPEYPLDFVWVAEAKRGIDRAFLPIAQVESTILATVIFAALLFVPKFIGRLVRNRSRTSKAP